MIISKDIAAKLQLPITNAQINALFEKLNLNPIRWAITEVKDGVFTIRVSIIV